MPTFFTLHFTSCSPPSAVLSGVTVTDGFVFFTSDVNGDALIEVDADVVASCSKIGFNAKNLILSASTPVGTTIPVCLIPQVGGTTTPGGGSGGGGATCFTGETLVTLADGTDKPIAMIREGDLVLGRSGEPNRVIGLDRTVLGNRRLYALNEGPHFVTAEHPFQTEEGWKAIDPDATAAENPELIVGRLTVNDRLVMLQGCAVPAGYLGAGERVEPVFESKPLVRMEGRHASPEMPLYNLFLDGDHAYFANGFLVHNKCFIVTATTGSSQSEEITELRQLRDRVAGVSRLSAQLIDVIYREYFEFSPEIAAELQRDVVAKKAVLWTIVRPLLAWYKLAGALALEHSSQEAIRQATQDLLSVCPSYLGASSIAAVLKAIRNGEELPVGTSKLLHDFAPRIREASRLRYASWAILDPLVRVWNSAANDLDVVDELSQWLATAPLESLPSPRTPSELDTELGALADFFEFKPSVRYQLGKRLMAAWPDAASVLKRHGFA